MSLITIGCGADANPEPRGNHDLCKQHGRALADEVRRLLGLEFKPLSPSVDCQLTRVELPFDQLPTKEQWEERAKQGGAPGYHARQFLARLNRGEEVPKTVTYPIATWTFGNDLAMVFLGGEVVVDYARYLREQHDASRLWITAYANEVPCYIASQRILREMGYEADFSMYFYARPTRLSADAEPLILNTVKKLLPAQFAATDNKADIPPPKEPAEALASIKVRPGLKVELVACEPLIVDPVAFDWGADGSLWVVEMRDYPLGLDGKGKPGGRVKRLTDTDGDGRYDKADLFLDDIPFPTGVKSWRGGVLVTAAPEIFYAEDTDGDGKADRRETLYAGFGEGNQQHRVNGLRWGLDNWLCVGNGDSGGTIKSLKTEQVVDVRGRDLRIRPDDGRIETQSGQTQFGRDRDDFGNWFGGNNSNPIWHYTLEDHYLRRNPHLAAPDPKRHISEQPGAAPVFPISRTFDRFNDFDRKNRFTSACSPMIYRDELLPGLSGNCFICEPVHNLVHREIVTPSGLSFTSRRADDEREAEFLASSDNWFRPTMIRTSPDGALWISDMYRFVIEHPQWIPADWQRRLNLRAGEDRGRIYRVVPADKPARPMPRLDNLDPAGLVAALDSPNGWVRDKVQELLVADASRLSKVAAVVAGLQRLATTASRPAVRLQSLCTLDGLGTLQPADVAAGLADESPHVRRHAIRLAESFFKTDVAEKLPPLVADPDPFVRQQLAYSLSEWQDPRAGRALAILLLESNDNLLTVAALSSLNVGNLPDVLDAVFSADPKPNSQLVERLVSMAAAFGEPAVIAKVLDRVLGPQMGERRFDVIASLLEALGKKNVAIDERFQKRIAFWATTARQVAGTEEFAESERLAAIRMLGRGVSGVADADLRVLEALLSARHSAPIQQAALTSLSGLDHAAIPDRLLADWKSHSPTLRGQILDALLARPVWNERLVSALERGDVSVTTFDARRRQQLLRQAKAELRPRIEKLLEGSVNTNRQQVVDSFRDVTAMKGDIANGKTLFAKRCSNCHRFEGSGHAVGPDLGSLADRSPTTLLVALLDPNRAVEDRYLEYLAVLNDGRQFSGVLTAEAGNSLTLTGPESKTTVLLRKDLETLRNTTRSLMPEGIEKDLSKQDLADVIAYLRTAAPPPKKFPGNQPETVRADGDGTLRLPATTARIYGSRIVFEQQYRNLGYWEAEDDRAVWTLEVPKAGRYRIVFDYACHDRSAGGKFLVSIAGQTLGGKVDGTGQWETYKTTTIGDVELPSGTLELAVRSDGPPRSALLDLRTVRLSPQ